MYKRFALMHDNIIFSLLCFRHNWYATAVRVAIFCDCHLSAKTYTAFDIKLSNYDILLKIDNSYQWQK